MEEIIINTEYIKLDQFLKLADIVESGGEAKSYIAHNNIYVNNERETRRGRKLREGDTVNVNGSKFRIVQYGG